MVDPLLAPFVSAGDDAAAEELLAPLLERHVLPLARAIAARKLRSYGKASSQWPDDVDDVVGDVTVTMVDRLGELRRSPGAPPIESLLDYTATVTHNALAHLLRRRHPERARLKNRLRYLLTHRDRIALWEQDGEGTVCGLAAHRSGSAGAGALASLRRVEEAGLPVPADDSPAGLAHFVEDLLRRVDGPVPFDALVGVVARLLHVDEPRRVSDAADVAAGPAGGEEAIDRRRALEDAWREITELPARQRAALLLGLREARGGSLLWLLPLVGVASVRRIAQVLEWTDAELAAAWPGLPLDDSAIALRLACTRQQVINLRMSARKRLANRHAARVGAPRAPRGGRANLTAVSPSLEGEP